MKELVQYEMSKFVNKKEKYNIVKTMTIYYYLVSLQLSEVNIC